jgi:hypothetical protein
MQNVMQKMSHEITEVTRRAIIDFFIASGLPWAGRLGDHGFLARLYDLNELPSQDHRYKSAAQDIYQHRIRNHDWDDDWVFYDTRFHLLRGSDDAFLRFLCESLHPVVRPSGDEVSKLLKVYNDALGKDNWQITKIGEISDRPTFAAQKLGGRIELFEEPTGWRKVDRQIQEVRLRLDTANSEEQYQTVGLLCREVLISVAQEVYCPDKHPTVDGIRSADTDARRMLDAIFEAELRGSTNEEARAHAKAAVRLALALQHKRTADFKTAALCAEGTWSVVNMLAVITRRRGQSFN